MMEPLNMSWDEKVQFIWACVGYEAEIAGPGADDVFACQIFPLHKAVLYVTGMCSELEYSCVLDELMGYAALYSGALPSELR